MKKTSHYLDLVIIFILAFLCAYTLLKINQNNDIYEYKYDITYFNNSNMFERITVVDYICSPGIRVSNQRYIWERYSHAFYASAWVDADAREGWCALKIKSKKVNK